MLVAVMQHMATLTESFEIARPVVARIMIEVGGRQPGAGGRARRLDSALPCPLRQVAAWPWKILQAGDR